MPDSELIRQRGFFVPLDTLLMYDEICKFVASGHPDRFRIIDFFQFFLNKDSPLSQKHENILTRASEAYRMADLDMNADYCEHLLNIGETKVVVIDGNLVGNSAFYIQLDDVAACYLSRVQNDNKWELFITLQTLYWEYTKRLRAEVSILVEEDKALKSMDIKTKITQPCVDLIKQIEQLKKDIFGENKRLSDIAETKIRKVSPESRATSAKMG